MIKLPKQEVPNRPENHRVVTIEACEDGGSIRLRMDDKDDCYVIMREEYFLEMVKVALAAIEE